MMKRTVSIILIVMMVCSMFAMMSVGAFAEGTGETATEQASGALAQALEKVKSFIPMEMLNEFKNEIISYVKELWAFIQSDETYKNIATAILAILAILFIPIIIAVVVIIYTIAALVAAISSALVAIIQLILTTLVGIFPTL